MEYKVVTGSFEYRCETLDDALSAYNILSKYVEFICVEEAVRLLSADTVWKEYIPEGGEK